MRIRLDPPPWRLQPFERLLAAKEASALTGSVATWAGDALEVVARGDRKTWNRLIRRLAFAHEVSNPSLRAPTFQANLEASVTHRAQKVTSYALHDLHPYKGKFYPQLARALLNVCEVPDGGVVVDPFAGCGTTTLEAALLGIKGIGFDLNPLAALVAQTKLDLLVRDPAEVKAVLDALLEPPPASETLRDVEYLRRWFPPENFRYLNDLVSAIEDIEEGIHRSAALVLLSSVLRRCSWQDPTQLRVGRRRSRKTINDLRTEFRSACEDLTTALRDLQQTEGFSRDRIRKARGRVLTADSRSLATEVRRIVRRDVDAIVTSPPYATALPYIDTDRLSLRAFGLTERGTHRELECSLIGNREVADQELNAYASRLKDELGLKDTWIPPCVRPSLQVALRVAEHQSSGFRKRRTPGLLYRYFLDMGRVMQESHKVLKPGGRMAIVVGDNTISGLDGPATVPTTETLLELALDVGFSFGGELDKRLTSYGAPETVHQRNAMKEEKVLLLRKN